MAIPMCLPKYNKTIVKDSFSNENLNLLFFNLVENSENGILLIDNNYDIKYANKKFLKLFPISTKLINKINIKEIFSENTYDKISTICSRLAKYKLNSEKMYLKNIVRGGEVFDIELRIENDQNILENELFILTFNNITNINKLKRLLTIAKKEAKSAAKLKYIFLSQMSHEIRTPVNKIVSFSNLLKEEVKGNITEELSDIFRIINKAGRRIVNTIESLLNLSEIEANSYKCTFRNLNLKSQILKPIINEYIILALEKGLSLVVKFRTKNFEIVADQYSITKIFTCLIDNAVKYTVRGNILISVEEHNQDDLIIKISDTGIGISKKFLQNIYTPFLQEELGYTRKYEGNGVGLYLVKKYCELNNISIDVNSQKGIGTTFILALKRNCSQPIN